MLEDLGHQIIQTQGPDRATELLKTCKADVVIAGADAACILAGSGLRTPILGVTDGNAEAAAACLAAGCTGILRPPFRTAAVARALVALEAKVHPDAANAA